MRNGISGGIREIGAGGAWQPCLAAAGDSLAAARRNRLG